jgi:hypothetical protein
VSTENYRLAAPLKRPHTAVDELELDVTIWMRYALACLPVGLQTITGSPQQACYRRRTDVVSLAAQLIGQLTNALAGPTQRRFRIAASGRLDQKLERFHQRGLLFSPRFPTSAQAANATLRQRIGRSSKIADSHPNGVPRHSRCPGDGAHATTPQRHRFDSRPPSASSLVEFRRQGLKLRANPFDDRCILHSPHFAENRETHKTNRSTYFRTSP